MSISNEYVTKTMCKVSFNCEIQNHFEYNVIGITSVFMLHTMHTSVRFRIRAIRV